MNTANRGIHTLLTREGVRKSEKEKGARKLAPFFIFL